MTSWFSTGVLAAGGTIQTELSREEWGGIAIVGALLIAALLGFSYRTRAGIIARAATKEAIRQPVFLLMLALAIVGLVVNTFLPFFSLGDDVKMLKDCGLAIILFCGVLLGVWTASTGVSEEIEGKTAMTLLSKPINRRQFILGKYIGILQAELILMTILSACFLALIYYKVGYDAKESGKEAPEVAERMREVGQIVPGLILIFFEAAVLSAISVAIATRLPMVVNLVTCFTIFVIGHLTPVLVSSADLKLEFVKFTGQLLAAFLPNLENFNINAAVATGAAVPASYLGASLLYCVAYSTAAILLAYLMFEDRDLA